MNFFKYPEKPNVYKDGLLTIVYDERASSPVSPVTYEANSVM
jgi:hypothetical protein